VSAPVVLGIAGSPRRHGNSEQLLDACLAGAAEAGAVTEKLAVVEYDLHPCRGCNACSLTGECVIVDRMRDVYPLLDRADAIVIGSPVFFATVPAVLKALYDRCQPYWARRWVLKQPPPPKRPGGLMLARAGGDPFGFSAAVTTTKSVFAVLGVTYDVEVCVAGVDSPSDMGRHTDGLAKAREAGSILARAAGLGEPRRG
jgi:multimeric flavodoxin WrbA